MSMNTRQVKHLNGSGKSARLFDCLTRRPRSRDYQDIEDESFDLEMSLIKRERLNVKLTKYMLRYLESKVDFDIVLLIADDPIFVLNGYAESICSYSYEEYGLGDLRDLMHCEVNPHLMILAMVHEVQPRDAWRAIFRTMPSRGGCVDYSIPFNDRVIELRGVAEFDRKGVVIGDVFEFDTYEGIPRKGVIDVLSPSISEPEYVVLGRDPPLQGKFGDVEYMSYRHVDSPESKTLTPHYRMYPTYGSIYTCDNNFNLPVPLHKMIKATFGCDNVLEVLPYPQDLHNLIYARPDLSELILSLLSCVVLGKVLQWNCPKDLKKQLKYIGKYTYNELFKDDLYKKTSFTNGNHGYGYEWDKLYLTMFK